MTRLRGRLLLGCGLAALLALQATALFRVAFNWDEFVLLYEASRTAQEHRLDSGNHAGLAQIALLPLVSDCRDEIAVGRSARAVWLLLTLAYAAGVFALLWQLSRESSHRDHDAALGTALLVLLPAFLEWSVQVRTDQVTLAGGAWGATALIASRRRPALAIAAGLALGLGWLSTQKLVYLAALAGLLAAGDLALRGEWRPRREARRAIATLAGFGVVVLAFRAYVGASFAVPDHHAALRGASPVVVGYYLDVFDFYRATIGYSQYLELLPTLGPHLTLLAALVLAPALSPLARTRRVALAWAVLTLGVAVGAFHAAAFTYFVMTLGLFPAVAFAIALPALRSALGQWEPRLVRPAGIALWAALALPVVFHALDTLGDTQAVQRQTLHFVHRNFSPEQAGFQPEGGLFCGARQPTGLWLSQRIYRVFEGPEPERSVETLLASFRAEPVYYLVQSFRLNQFPAPVRRFWADHYQPYRDSVFVAGQRLQGEPGGTSPFELLVSGAYRWLPLGGSPPVRIDGLEVAPGGVVELASGPHEVTFAGGPARGLLVLALADPPGPAPLSFYKTY